MADRPQQFTPATPVIYNVIITYGKMSNKYLNITKHKLSRLYI